MAVTPATTLDAQKLRADFAVFDELVNGKPVAYLDSASSTQKPRQVLDAMREFYEHSYANVHRGVYTLAERATAGYEGAREKVRAYVNAPSSRERRRLALLGAGAAIVAGWFLGGPALALPLALAGPPAVAWAISSRRRRYRRAVERSLPEMATAIADSLSAGRSLRASLAESISSLDGPGARELGRLAGELELGAGTAEAVARWRRRMRSERVDSFAAALLSQRLAGGDLAGLLRRFAVGAAERERVAEDARSATAQARFTGLLVVAMPTGGAVLAELLEPGFFATLLASPPAAVLLGLAAALQAVGFLAIRRFSQVVE